MEAILNEIKEYILKPLAEKEIFIDSIEYVKENNYYFLKITLDKINGIDLDTIVEATKIINKILDKNDLIDKEYILDVSSKERG